MQNPKPSILAINKFYYQFGGVENYHFRMMELLTKHGHRVVPFGMQHPGNPPTEWSRFFVSEVDYDDASPLSRLRSAGRALYSFEARRKLRELITETHPQIAHLHHIYHQISTSVLYELRDQGIPIVQTVHDYKMVCPNAKLYVPRTQEVCFRCKGHHYLNAIGQNCGSYGIGSSIQIAFLAYAEQVLQPYQRMVSKFISLSTFLKDKLVESGIDGNKITVIPNFIDASLYAPQFHGDYVLYVGRLESYKGVQVFIEAARHLPHIQFKVIGTGTYEAALREQAARETPNVEFMGRQDHTVVRQMLTHCLCLVAPSIWYDIAPVVTLEAYASGKPVIVSNMGGLPEPVQDGVTGFLVPPGSWEAIAEYVTRLSGNAALAEQMGRAGLAYVQDNHSPGRFYERLMAVYGELPVRTT
ncbi:MAG TPA: glycosyltransferase family 4 protein [Anaerolineae bacterium]|jgi:glycosyltransferase involved in cell wall biosynthesis